MFFLACKGEKRWLAGRLIRGWQQARSLGETFPTVRTMGYNSAGSGARRPATPGSSMGNSNPSEEIARFLLTASSYREFLRLVFEFKKSQRSGFSYAMFARRAGFSSKSFARDVILGKKGIAGASVERFIQGLGLRGELAACFRLLVQREDKETVEDPKAAERIETRLASARARIARRFEREPRNGAELPWKKLWPFVFASLGHTETGATLPEIVRKSGLETDLCRATLAEMEKLGVARFDAASGCFCPCSAQAFLDNLGTDRFLIDFFSQLAERAMREAAGGIRRDDRLFLGSVVSVSSRRLEEIRLGFRDLLAQFVDSVEEPDGDCLLNLMAAVFPNKA